MLYMNKYNEPRTAGNMLKIEKVLKLQSQVTADTNNKAFIVNKNKQNLWFMQFILFIHAVVLVFWCLFLSFDGGILAVALTLPLVIMFLYKANIFCYLFFYLFTSFFFHLDHC